MGSNSNHISPTFTTLAKNQQYSIGLTTSNG